MPHYKRVGRCALLLASVLAVAGCSNESADLAEKLAAAEAAATRAETAAKRAESAAKAAGAPPPVQMEADPVEEIEGDATDDDAGTSDTLPTAVLPASGT